jgi:transposase
MLLPCIVKEPSVKSKSRRRSAKRARREQKILEMIHLNAAGVDIGSESHWVSVPEDRDDQPVREFKSFTHELIALADWLQACGIDTVAMESTGVYWIPLYEILEERGIEVLLVNARHVKGVPGRKSDVLDCQWIQQLHTFGLLRGSFRPDAPITAVRTLVRHRDQLVEAAASYVQRMQKAMVLMNLQLHNVISDVTGVTGIAILRDIVAGETDPTVLARHRHPRCKASEQEIAASLTGHYRDEHLFVLRQAIELYDLYQEKILCCDEQIEARIRALEATCESPGRLLPKARRTRNRSSNEPHFEIRSPLFVLCGGVDLTELPGIGPYGALKLISEIGLDMSRWPTEDNFASWLTVAPRNRISGGKLLSSRTQPSANRAAKILRMAAMSLGRGDHALGAFYRRMGARVGKAKAITATARKLAVLVYRMLRHKMHYQERSAADYDQQQRSRILRGLRKRAASLGFEIVDTTTGLVM